MFRMVWGIVMLGGGLWVLMWAIALFQVSGR